MPKKFLLFMILLPLFSFTGLHKFYVSVTDIEYNPETEALQVISRVFADDMEKLLRMRYSDEIRLTKEQDSPTADHFLQKYISQKLHIKVNGKEYPLNYLGKKYDKDQLVLFIEVEKVEVPRAVFVTNKILFDAFPDQKNVVQVETGGKIKSLLLSREKESGVVNFSE